MIDDIRYAWRLAVRAPLINGLIVVVLAVGLGTTVAMFTIVRGVVLAPMPFADAERLVTIETHLRGPDLAGGFTSYPDFMDWRAQSTTIDRMGAYAVGTVTVTGSGDAATLQTAFVSDDLLSLLGPVPIRGSLFQEDAARRGLPVIMISEALWRARLGADPNIVGRALTLDDRAYTIAGVLPAHFQFPIQPDPVTVWVPFGSHPFMAALQQKRTVGVLHVVGRLKPAATIGAAQSDLSAIVARLNAQFPLANANRAVVVSAMRQDLVRGYESQLLLLLAAAAAVLLTGCANVAHLLLARAMARRRELVVRAALGAGRVRLVRQLLTESVMLATAGGATGLLLAWWLVDAIVPRIPTYVPRLRGVHIDPLTVAVAAAITFVTGVLFGSLPALRASKADAGAALRDARGSSGRGTRVLRVVVIAEAAVSLMLLTTAGLLARSLAALQRVDPGFRADHLMTLDVSLPDTRYHGAPAQTAFEHRLLDGVRAIPGVSGAAIATTLPLSGADLGAAFTIDGRPNPDNPNGYYVAPYYSVSPAFFATLGVPVLRGRPFADSDGADAVPVLVVSESLAQKYFPGEDPVGRHIRLGFGRPGTTYTIVGVVGDVKQRELGQAMQPQFYTAFAQLPWPFMSVIARARVEPDAIAASLRRVLAGIDPHQPSGEIKTMDEYVARSTATPSMTALIVGGLAGFAALLAAVGLYGVMAYSVALRRREFGIRLALGAPPRSVGWLVMREALLVSAGGVVIGVAGALAAARVVRGLLYGVQPDDPATFAGVAAGLTVVLLAAALAPARRSVRTDPLESLRVD
jgi:putative ABC transport system permease protein